MLSIKCLILIIIIFLIILGISIINYSYFINKNKKYYNATNNYIDKSSVGGRGVFAGKSYKQTEIIEICPTIVDNAILLDRTKLKDYVFKLDDYNNIICLGYGSLFSHSDNPNASYKIKYIDNEPYMLFFATKQIDKNSEIFISYSKKWWDERENRINKINN